MNYYLNTNLQYCMILKLLDVEKSFDSWAFGSFDHAHAIARNDIFMDFMSEN